MATLNDRNDIRYRKDGNLYKVLANSLSETNASGTAHDKGTYKFTSSYEIQTFELDETDDTITGVTISGAEISKGTLKCHEFIEGEYSE